MAIFSRNISNYLSGNYNFLCVVLLSVFLLVGGTDCSAYESERVRYTVQGKAVSKNVYKAAMLVNESITLIKQNAYDRGLGKLKHAILIAPELSQSYIYMGVIYARQDRNKDAIAQLKKAVQCKDAPALAYATLATLYQTVGDLDGAIDTFKKMRSKFSTDADLSVRSEKIVELLERERDRRKEATGSSKGSQTPGDYLQDALQAGFHKWSLFRMPLKVYIQPTQDVEGYTPHYDDLLHQAFYDWSRALKGKLSFVFVDNPEKADIECHWTNDPSELGDGTENGETRIKFIGETIVSATMALRAKEPEGGFPFSENLVLTTCIHEAGHALGLSGHSPDPQDVMFFSVPLADVERKVSERDKNTMLKIYTRQQAPQYVLIDFLVNPVNSALVGLATFLLILIGIIVPRLAKQKRKKRR